MDEARSGRTVPLLCTTNQFSKSFIKIIFLLLQIRRTQTARLACSFTQVHSFYLLLRGTPPTLNVTQSRIELYKLWYFSLLTTLMAFLFFMVINERHVSGFNVEEYWWRYFVVCLLWLLWAYVTILSVWPGRDAGTNSTLFYTHTVINGYIPNFPIPSLQFSD